MATIAPPTVKEFDASSLEKIAYESVKTIPTKEQNDQYRLGYHVWNYLKDRKGTLEQAIKRSGSRILISEKETLSIIEQELKKAGVEHPV